MHFRQVLARRLTVSRRVLALGLMGMTALAAMTPLGAMAQSVVELPGVHASADAGCVEPTHEGSPPASSSGTPVALSYACLNRMMAADVAPATLPDLGADVSKRPTNSLGLYNASGLRNRMGQNLGISVHPYRPKVTYPTPLATPTH